MSPDSPAPEGNFLSRIFHNLEHAPELAKVVEVHATTLRGTDGHGILNLIGRARGFLRAAGVQPGDRVALCAPNSVRWIAADLAVLASGGIIVPLYDRQEPKDLAKMLRSAEPTLVIAAHEELKNAIEGAWSERGECRFVCLPELFEGDAEHVELHPTAAKDPVAIIYTSGTSGEPKGVVLDRDNIDFMIPQTMARLGKVVGPKSGPDRVFHYLPFCFAASRLMLWTQLSRPNPIMLSTDLQKLVVEMAAAKPNYFLNVPAVLERIRTGVGAKLRERGGAALRLYEAGARAFAAQRAGTATLKDRLALQVAKTVVFSKVRQQIGPNLEFLISGSAPLLEETQVWFEMLGIPVYQAYGLTETTGIVSLDEPGTVVAGRVGTPIEGVEVKLGDDAELLVRGPNIFAGYWRQPEETAKVMLDGWFRTGDQIDLQGGDKPSLKIIGRVKNLLVPESGHNVAPEPLEERFLYLCPDAKQCVVVGHGKPFLALLITGNPPLDTVERALEQLNADQPSYRKIRSYALLAEEFTPEAGTLTANMKLRRSAIEQRYAGEIAEMYATAPRPTKEAAVAS